MDFDQTRRLRTSNSRNFSRPFPSPLSTGQLNTPTNPSKTRDIHTNLRLSASQGKVPKHVISHESIATNRELDFVRTHQNGHFSADISHDIAAVTWDATSSSERSLSSRDSMTSSYSGETHSANQDLGTTAPILNFRPNLWRYLERDREVLNIDLFWPVKVDKLKEHEHERDAGDSEEDNPRVFPYASLKPLLTFRNLHSLHLTGMMQSYQPLIWATCWLNSNLTRIRLEMSLQPLMNVNTDIPHRQINVSWSLKPSPPSQGETEYLGHHGTGILHEEFGDGEYLDTQAISLARQDMIDEIPQSNAVLLPIKNLTLMNFVVDAWPIIHWFDPKKLEEIIFKSGCIDAGFYLPFSMMHVKIQHPAHPAGPARVVKPGELKLVELKGGKVVSRKDAVMASPKKQGDVCTSSPSKTITSSPSSTQSTSLRHKFSQLMPTGAMARKVSIRQGKNKGRNKGQDDENKPITKAGGGKEEGVKGEVAASSMSGNIEGDGSVFSDKEVRAAKDGKKGA